MACLVAPGGTILLTAANDPTPPGVDSEAYNVKDDKGQRAVKYVSLGHAEVGLIAWAARLGKRTDGNWVYTTRHPCATCADALRMAGIKRLVSLPADYTHDAYGFLEARRIMDLAGIEVTLY
jgi:dCMP deaminase